MRIGIGWGLVVVAIAGCVGNTPVAREGVARTSLGSPRPTTPPSPTLAASPTSAASPGARANGGPMIRDGSSPAPASSAPASLVPASGSPRPRPTPDLTAANVVVTLAGTGEEGDKDGQATQATFGFPSGIGVDAKGRLYVSDYGHNRLRWLETLDSVSTLAGVGPGSADGAANASRFNNPAGLAVSADGTRVVVADYYNNRIREARIVDGAWRVSTLAGTSAGMLKDGTGEAAQFWYPTAVALAKDGTAYVTDSYNNCVRKVTPAGVVTTLAASGLLRPAGLALSPKGVLWVADTGHHRLCMIKDMATAPALVAVAGGPASGETDGPAVLARFSNPRGLAFDSDGVLYVADTDNHRVRRVTFDEEGAATVSTAAGDGHAGFEDGPRAHARFGHPQSVAVDLKKRVYVTDGDNRAIRRIQFD